jgi:hypothetical protein
MAIALIFLVFFAAFVWSIARSAGKLKTALIGIGVMIATELTALASITLSSARADRSMHALAWDVGFGGVLALPAAVLSGSVAALIVSRKSRKQLATEGSH